MHDQQFEYVGCRARAWASVIDSVLGAIIILPILTMVYGQEYWSSDRLLHGPVDFLVSWVFPVVLFLGFIWVAFDDRKQGWHDKLAGTLVVRK